MAFDAHKNLAVSLVATAPSPATSGTSLVVTAGQGTRFPTAPFPVTICPAGVVPDPSNAEIAYCTGRATDTLTLTRAQEGTSARTVVVGDQVTATVTNKTFTDIETLLAAAGLPIATLADPTTGKVIGSTSSAAAAVYPPGYEIGYDQITSNVNVTATSEATGTTIITCAAHTFDGNPVMAQFWTPDILIPSTLNGYMAISLFESTTQIGSFGYVDGTGGSATPIQIPYTGWRRFTPTAGSHTYTVTAFVSATTGTPKVDAGAGGTATVFPAFIRFTKV